MKKTYKIYLEEPDYRKLLLKANDSGFNGRGAISHFLKKLAQEPLVFLDSNAKAMLKALK